jgi:uncharacterized membrane protein
MTAVARVDRAGSVAAIVLSSAVLAWAMALPLAAVAGAADGWPRTAGAAVYAAGSLVCHQKAARSFTAGHRRWPVCARCTGIYLAAGIAVLYGLGARGIRAGLASLSTAAWRALFAAALAPVAVSWGVERAGLWGGSNMVRAVAGIPLGLAVAAAIVANLPSRQGAPGDLR